MQFIIVGLIGLVSSFLSNLSGGGGALILLPSLMTAGIPPLTAIGTIKVGSVGLVAGSVISSRNKGVVRKDYLLPMLIIVTAASILGPRLTLSLSNEQAKIVSSIIIVCTAVVALISLKLNTKSRQVSKTSRYLGYGAYFLTSTVLAGIGSGIGIIINYVLIGLLGMSPIETVSTRRITGIVGTPLQLLAFAYGGQINWGLGISLLIGSAIGGYFGMNTAIKRGNVFIKRAMAIASIALVASLFLR